MLAKFVPITLELNLYLIRNIISRHVHDHVVLTTAKQVISRRSWDKNDCEMYKNKKKIKKLVQSVEEHRFWSSKMQIYDSLILSHRRRGCLCIIMPAPPEHARQIE